MLGCSEILCPLAWRWCCWKHIVAPNWCLVPLCSRNVNSFGLSGYLNFCERINFHHIGTFDYFLTRARCFYCRYTEFQPKKKSLPFYVGPSADVRRPQCDNDGYVDKITPVLSILQSITKNTNNVTRSVRTRKNYI